MDDRLFVPLLGLESFNSVVDLLGQEGAKAALLTGLVDGQKSHLAAGVARHLKKSILFITHNEEKAKEALQDLAFFANYPTFNLPPLDFMIGIADVSSKEVAKERLQTLETLLQGGEPFVVVAAADALLSPLSPKEKFVGSILNIGDADEINLGEAAEKLVNMGYIRSEQVEGCGQFAIRGGILDVFAPNNDNPLRIELWGDEVDSIRAFDPITQRSIEGEKLLDAQIYPMAELLEGDGEVATLFDYIPKDTLVVFDEAPRIVEAWERKQEEKTTFLKELLDQGKISPQACEIDINHNSILKEAEGFDTLFLSLMATSGLKRFKIDDIIGFEGRATTRFKGNVEALREELAYLSNQSYQAIVIAKHKLDDITRLEGEISQGFEYPQIKFAILNFDDGAEKQKKRRRKRGRYKGLPINHFSDLKVGDYVVHDAHGLGMYHGIEKIHVDGVFRDYFKIGFKGDANLYVATSQLDVLQKYIGGEGAKPALNRLGGEAWQKTKTKARMAIEETAKEIVELYAKRDSITGYAFTPDTVWQGEFEDAFIHQETDDQLAAVEDIKKDMESLKVMDRLVCGDVGYGKTEVAIRAAFKAVCDQKQVVFLCPTTILAQQHYNTFVQRMKEYPINIQVASRFKGAKETKKVLEDVTKGQVDILIGTHRLLSKDVSFKDLGLIIIDEEQRFGVMHKERLKQTWPNVDVITLSATPIPRTLHMSLSGIRDMSILNEPPLERQPVQTYVMEHLPEMVKSAIKRELARDGQVYYLHNRVENIEKTTAKIKELVPEAEVAYAHGQMGEKNLEAVMMDFVEGHIDVLVCTTIVESGLDIPNVNTIIIQDADKLGLSQLYQLRGRVGRHSRSSFAYLMYQKDKILTEIAEKRLQTIREFTEFGAGFKIAMRDLEIRGAGNLLGVSQHGHMDAIGYEMYCKLLDIAIREMRGMEVKETFETLIDLVVDAYISNAFIPREGQRLDIYKKIAHIQTQDDFFDVQEEIEDRYGTMPQAMQNLLDIALLKAKANATDITAIKQKGQSITITFKPDADVDPLAISKAVTESRGRLKFSIATNPYLTYKIVDEKEIIGELSDVISSL